MKHLFTAFNLIGAIALLALTVSCTMTQRETEHKEKYLLAAGFKVGDFVQVNGNALSLRSS